MKKVHKGFFLLLAAGGKNCGAIQREEEAPYRFTRVGPNE
jgi:hypothetical protein